MNINGRLIIPAAVALSFAAMVMVTGATPAAAAEQGRYCIAQSGTAGENSYTGSCIFSDYQQCLQAAAGTRGNCVENIDRRRGMSQQDTGQGRRAR